MNCSPVNPAMVRDFIIAGPIRLGEQRSFNLAFKDTTVETVGYEVIAELPLHFNLSLGADPADDAVAFVECPRFFVHRAYPGRSQWDASEYYTGQKFPASRSLPTRAAAAYFAFYTLLVQPKAFIDELKRIQETGMLQGVRHAVINSEGRG